MQKSFKTYATVVQKLCKRRSKVMQKSSKAYAKDLIKNIQHERIYTKNIQHERIYTKNIQHERIYTKNIPPDAQKASGIFTL